MTNRHHYTEKEKLNTIIFSMGRAKSHKEWDEMRKQSCKFED